MTTRSLVAAICFLLIVWFGGAASAQMYTWTDEQGNIHFSDTPPSKGKTKVIQELEPRCSLAKFVSEFGEGKIRELIGQYGNGSTVDRKDVPSKFVKVFDAIQTEKRKCSGEDEAACQCLSNLADSGLKSYSPEGDLFRVQPAPRSRSRR
jgi:hypothetical protein